MAETGVAASPGKTRPRAKNGKFASSHATQKRRELGLEKQIPLDVSTAYRKGSYARNAPEVPAEMRLQTAEAVAAFQALPPEGKRLATSKFSPITQHYKKTAALELIYSALPDAAKYLVNLVKGAGKCSTAPHSVRRQAAVDLLTLGRIGEGSAAAGKELSEMTADELQSFISTTKQELASRPSKAKEVQGEVVREDEGRVPDNLSGTTGNRFRDIDLT